MIDIVELERVLAKWCSFVVHVVCCTLETEQGSLVVMGCKEILPDEKTLMRIFMMFGFLQGDLSTISWNL